MNKTSVPGNFVFPDKLCAPVAAAIERFSRFAGPILVAIDGMCASGKSTLGQILADRYGAALFHADDYFLPPRMRTPERLGAPGGNMHRERLAEEVLIPLFHNRPPVTHRFDCHTMTLEPPVTHKLTRVNIIEGSYTLHPDLCGFYTLKIALRTTPQLQLERLTLRAPDRADDFIVRWIPMENAYFDATGLYSRADIVIDT